MTNHKDLDDHSSLTLVDRIKDSALLGVYSGTQCFFFLAVSTWTFFSVTFFALPSPFVGVTDDAEVYTTLVDTRLTTHTGCRVYLLILS